MINNDEHFRKDVAYHDVIAPEYDTVVVKPRWLSIDALFRPISRLLPAHRASMLDMGTGTGHMLLRYAKSFTSVLAVDHSRNMLEVARRSVADSGIDNVTFLEQNAVNYLETESRSFDFITCVGFLHHLEPQSLPLMLELLRKRLAPGGRLLLSEPVVTDAAEPTLVRRWNRAYASRPNTYSVHAVDPDEAPLHLVDLRRAISQAGLISVAERRGWELFDHPDSSRLIQRLGIELLHRVVGSTGPVYWTLCTASA